MRRLLLLAAMVVVAFALVSPGSAAIVLNESHGPSWVTWGWNVTSLNESEQLVGRYDGQVVINQTANSTPPLLTSYSVTGVDPNEPHVFELILLNQSTSPATVEEVQSSSTTTSQSESVYLVFLGLGFALCVLGFLVGKGNWVIGLLLLAVAFILGGYVAAAMAATNSVLSLFGLVVCIVALVGLVITTLDVVKTQSGWGGE